MSIEEYVVRVWKHYASIKEEMYGLKAPSMPLIYHGDYSQYRDSVLKIVTAGLNPPSSEFPENNPLIRFKELDHFYGKETLNEYDVLEYLDSLDSYFRRNSNPWFDNFEPVLNGINASYYGVMESTVLHTEMLSPLSTVVSWSKFVDNYPSFVIDEIVTNGHAQWLELMNILQPDIIITSLGEKYRKNIFNIQNLNWRRIEQITTTTKGGERKRPYEVYCTIATLGCGKKCLLVFGDRNVVPFMISEEQKIALGSKLFHLMKGIYNSRKKEPIPTDAPKKIVMKTLH
ncbi:MAG: hypothetical protein NWF07_11460 [Candidatus Bathyarchaeota archaeon]|nr:hypothetical protein [Candidatus Bathyarchaeota archaeon]